MRDFFIFFISVALSYNHEAEFDLEMQQWKSGIMVKRKKDEVHVLFAVVFTYLYPVVNPPPPTQAEERL
jgi:hypothetical protein